MKYKPLGNTGVQVSELCFGTMSFGGDADEEELARMYAACRDAGINFFDCADIYSKGRAEEILGGLIAGERDQLVITSKCFNALSDDVNDRGTSRRHIALAVEASLKRLKTDRLDVLFMHQWDATTPLEETLRGLEDVVRAGKVLYLGASNYAAWQVATGLGISARRGWSRFDVIQPMYNLVKRQAEVEILPLARGRGTGRHLLRPAAAAACSAASIAGDGKHAEGGRMANKPIRCPLPPAMGPRDRRRFAAFAKRARPPPGEPGGRLGGGHPAITCPIIGARNVEQLAASLKAAEST